ncbi:MAG: type II toxin-antitoxin system VapC family toxin [Theionarchaea archaeon]|nr:type II toxin-antitoxin system VapC family toxin [Theionarchaea archaeon]
MNLVLDSSVIAKLFIEEGDSHEAVELFQKGSLADITLTASELVLYEVGNTLLKHCRNTDIDVDEHMMRLFYLNVEYTLPHEILFTGALKTAKLYNITYYDAVHVALAEHCKSFLVTEDRELLKKIEDAINMKEALRIIEGESGKLPGDNGDQVS